MNLGDGRIVLIGVSAAFAATAIGSMLWSRRAALPGGGTILDAPEVVPHGDLVQTDSPPAAPTTADGDADVAAHQLAAALDAQASLFSDGAGEDSRGRCFDNFSIGYLAGFVDAALHQLDIGSEARTLAALDVVATHLTRPVAGAAAWLLQDLARLHAAGDSQFMRGLGDGAADARAWLRREIESPARWADYVLNEANALPA